MLKDLNKNTIYKKYFIESLTVEKMFLNVIDIDRENKMKEKIFNMNEQAIYDCELKGANKIFNTQVAKLLFDKYNIKYDYFNHTNIVFFFTDFL
jgi:nitric oxide synthase oxygenase domain/subunit